MTKYIVKASGIPASPGIADRRMFLRFLDGLNERQRRQAVAFEASQLGWGGISRMRELTRMRPETICRGLQELKHGKACALDGRIRRPGAGRPPLEKKYPGIEKELSQVVDHATAGDPCSAKKWTRMSLRAIAAVLRKRGRKIGKDAVCRLLKKRSTRSVGVVNASRASHPRSGTASSDISKCRRKDL